MSIMEKAAKIKLLILDVDGVLTSGELFYSAKGESLKVFNVKDGLGIKLLQHIGVEIAVITGRSSNSLKTRMRELNVNHVFQNQQNKNTAFNKIVSQLNLKESQVCYIGDDLPDLPLMQKVGLAVTVANAHTVISENADWITSKKGGEGAVRELADLLIHAQGKAEEVMGLFNE